MEEHKMQNKVRFKIGDIEFEAEGDAEIIERERKEFVTTLLPLAVDAMTRTISNRQIQQIPTLPQSTAIDDADLPQDTENLNRTSLASFVKQKGAERHTDFVLCAVFFNEKKNKIGSFSTTTAKNFYSEAKRTLPANMTDTINQLARRGLIMESPTAKGATPTEYILTDKGEEYVNDFRPIPTKARKKSSKTRKQRKKTT
jgi:DNA-binding PadR family transcriptional regulator